MKSYKFKGGPTFLNSGGFGPDDLMIKPIEGGRWVLVIFRWGRHFTGNKADAESDRAARKSIGQIQPVHTAANYERWRKARERGTLVTMNATEFWQKYG